MNRMLNFSSSTDSSVNQVGSYRARTPTLLETHQSFLSSLESDLHRPFSTRLQGHCWGGINDADERVLRDAIARVWNQASPAGDRKLREFIGEIERHSDSHSCDRRHTARILRHLKDLMSPSGINKREGGDLLTAHQSPNNQQLGGQASEFVLNRQVFGGLMVRGNGNHVEHHNARSVTIVGDANRVVVGRPEPGQGDGSRQVDQSRTQLLTAQEGVRLQLMDNPQGS